MATHETVCINFARQTGKNCNGSRNPHKYNGYRIYYRDKTLYSYGDHFPLAIIRGSDAFINYEPYTSATHKHRSHAFRALTHWHTPQPFDAPCDIMEALDTVDGAINKPALRQLYNWYLKQRDKCIASAGRRRLERTFRFDTKQAKRWQDQAQRLQDTFKLGKRALPGCLKSTPAVNKLIRKFDIA